MKSSLKKRKSSSQGRQGDNAKVRRGGNGCTVNFEDAMRLKDPNNFDAFETKLLEICTLGKDIDDKVRAVYELALFYCQIGVFDKADLLLRALGFRYRLGCNIWTMTSRDTRSDVIPSTCFDNVFPTVMINKFLDIFRADSSFWCDHGYPSDTFFSYNTPLSKDTALKGKSRFANNLIAQLASYLKPLVLASFPHVGHDDIQSVEWWAHTRPDGPSAGHRVR
jgi:hypothetical protein